MKSTSAHQRKKSKSAGVEADNVFAAMGYPNAVEHSVKADFVLLIADLIKDRGITQTKAAEILGVSQPDISNILRGRFSGFGLERLLGFVNALGKDVRINITQAKEHKPGRVLVNA